MNAADPEWACDAANVEAMCGEYDLRRCDAGGPSYDAALCEIVKQRNEESPLDSWNCANAIYADGCTTASDECWP